MLLNILYSKYQQGDNASGSKNSREPQTSRSNSSFVDHCSPCGPEFMPPVYGRFGWYYLYNPNNETLPSVSLQNCLKAKKAGRTFNKLDISKSQAKSRLDALYSKFPKAPKPFNGPFNTMWDPLVRRGDTIVHFTTLEKRCPKPQLKQRQKKRANMNPLFANGGRIITYPNVTSTNKQELVDYSLFLEEQNVAVGAYNNGSSQTEQHSGILNEEFLPYDSILEDIRFRRGVDAETHTDYCQISADKGYTVSPIQHSIHRISKIMANQTISQSVLESMECEELKVVRGQCESLSLWMASEQRRKFQERRDYCKTLKKIRMLEKMELEVDIGMKEAEGRVGAGMFALNFIRTLIERGMAKFENEGLVGPRTWALNVAFGAQDWVNKYAEIGVHNKGIGRSILDDLIVEANRRDGGINTNMKGSMKV